jgi:hypothetical protein
VLRAYVMLAVREGEPGGLRICKVLGDVLKREVERVSSQVEVVRNVQVERFGLVVEYFKWVIGLGVR